MIIAFERIRRMIRTRRKNVSRSSLLKSSLSDNRKTTTQRTPSVGRHPPGNETGC